MLVVSTAKFKFHEFHMDKTTKYKIIIAVTDVEMNSIWSNLVNIRKTNFEMYNLHMMSVD